MALNYIGSTTFAGTTAAVTLTAVNIGTASADRLVVVVAKIRRSSTPARTLSSLTIGGNAATEVIKGSQDGTRGVACGIYSLLVTSGTTADIVVTASGTYSEGEISVYTLTNLASTTAHHSASNGNTTATALSVSLNIPSNGIAIGGWGGCDGSNAASTWSGLSTENVDGNTGGLNYSSASQSGMSSETGRTITLTPAGRATNFIVAASWQENGSGPTITGSQTLDTLSQSASVGVTVKASGAQTLDTLSQSANVGVRASVTGSQTLDTLSQSANATVGSLATVTGAQTLDTLSQTANAAVTVKASGSQTLATLSQTTSVAAIVKATASQTLPTLSQSANASAAIVTLDPSGLNSALTLSNGNLTVEHTGADADANIRIASPVTSGKYYAEFTVDVFTTTDYNTIQFGVCTESLAKNLIFWNGGSNSVGTLTAGGGWSVNFTATGTTASYVQGDRVGIAWDVDNGKIWMRVNNGAWQGSASGGDPAAGTSGYAFNPSGSKQLGVSLYKQNQKVTAKISSASWTDSAPSGFVQFPAPVGALNVSGAQTLDTLSQTANAAVTVKASGSQTLATLSQSANVATSRSVSGAQTLDTLSQSAAGKVIASVSGAQTLDTLSQSASVTANGARLVSGSQTLDTLSQSANAVVVAVRAVSGAQTIDPPTQSAAAALLVKLSGAQAIPIPTLVALVAPPRSASAAQSIGLPTFNGVVQTEFWKEENDPSGLWSNNTAPTGVWSGITPPSGSWS